MLFFFHFTQSQVNIGPFLLSSYKILDLIYFCLLIKVLVCTNSCSSQFNLLVFSCRCFSGSAGIHLAFDCYSLPLVVFSRRGLFGKVYLIIAAELGMFSAFQIYYVLLTKP